MLIEVTALWRTGTCEVTIDVAATGVTAEMRTASVVVAVEETTVPIVVEAVDSATAVFVLCSVAVVV